MAHWASVAAVAASLRAASAAAAQPRLDAERILSQRFGNDSPWYRGSIPLFESADPERDRPALANGITDANWARATMTRLRITMRATPGRRIRLIELKAF